MPTDILAWKHPPRLSADGVGVVQRSVINDRMFPLAPFMGVRFNYALDDAKGRCVRLRVPFAMTLMCVLTIST